MLIKTISTFLYRPFTLLLLTAIGLFAETSTIQADPIGISPPRELTPLVTHHGVSVRFASNQTSESGKSITLAIQLKSKPTSSVEIILKSSNRQEGIAFPNRLKFSPENWNQTQFARIKGQDDVVIDGDVKFDVEVSTTSDKDFNYIRLAPRRYGFVNLDNDQAGIIVNQLSKNTSESGNLIEAKIQLTSRPTSDVRLFFNSDRPREAIVITDSIVFSKDKWNQPQIITIKGVDDDIIDGTQKVPVSATVPSSDDIHYHGLSAEKFWVYNEDNDSAALILGDVSGKTSEGNKRSSFTIKLSSRPKGEVLVFLFSDNPNEGVPHVDHLRFSPENWNMNQKVIVTGIDDHIADGDVTYKIRVVSKSKADQHYNSLKPYYVTLINSDNDSPNIVLDTPKGRLTEQGGQIVIPIHLTTKPREMVRIGVYSKTPNEAKILGSEIVLTPKDWDQKKAITVMGVDDGFVDGPQKVIVAFTKSVSKDPNYNGRLLEEKIFFNYDDDRVGIVTQTNSKHTSEKGDIATINVRLSSIPRHEVTLKLSSSDPGEGEIDRREIIFDQSNWNIGQEVKLTGKNDDDNDGDQSYSVILHPLISKDKDYQGYNPADLPFTNLDSNTTGFTLGAFEGHTSEKGETVSIPVWLNAKPTSPVKLSIKSLNPKEGMPVIAYLFFNPSNWDQPQTIKIKGIDEDYDDGDQVYSVEMSADSDGDDNFKDLMPARINLKNKDDDQFGITVQKLGNVIKESGESQQFKIRLKSAPVSSVILPFNNSDSTEAIVQPSFVLFDDTNWDQEQLIEVIGIGDNEIDGNQTLTVNTTGAFSKDQQYSGITFKPMSFINIDLDKAGIKIGPISRNTTEKGGQATFTVKLLTSPDSKVHIRFASSDLTEGDVEPKELIIDSNNWNEEHIITVTGLDDELNDDDEYYKILISPAFSKDSNYQGFKSDPVVLQNIDYIRHSVGISSVYTSPLGSFKSILKPEISYGVAYSYNLNFNWEMGGRFSTVSFNGIEGEYEYQMDLTSLSFDCRYHWIRYPVKIYPKVGIGLYQWHTSTYRTTTRNMSEGGGTDLGFSYGLGMEAMVFSYFLINFEPMYHTITGKYNNNNVFTISLSILYSI